MRPMPMGTPGAMTMTMTPVGARPPIGPGGTPVGTPVGKGSQRY